MPRNDALYSVEDIEYVVTRAGQLVYGSDERLDDLVRETHRFLDQVTAQAERDSGVEG